MPSGGQPYDEELFMQMLGEYAGMRGGPMRGFVPAMPRSLTERGRLHARQTGDDDLLRLLQKVSHRPPQRRATPQAPNRDGEMGFFMDPLRALKNQDYR